MSETYLVRQAIFDRHMRTVGYELLLHGGEGSAKDQSAGPRAIVAALADVGLDTLVGDLRAFVPVGSGLIAEGQLRLWPADRLVAQVPARLAANPDVVTELRRLVGDGYGLAVDEDGDGDSGPLLGVATIVRLRQGHADEERLAVLKARPSLATLVSGISSREEYEGWYRRGADLFQGEYFARPEVRHGRAISAGETTRLQLIASLQDADTDPTRLELLVSRDLGLSHRLLLYVNSAYFGMPREINSIREAIMLLGFRQLRLLATLVSLADSSEHPQELLVSALVRARMAELLAPAVQANPDGAFTVGLFSAADSLLDIPMAELMERLPFSEETKAALTEREGPLGRLLQVVLTYEAGGLVLAVPGITIATCRQAYIDAVAWSTQVGRPPAAVHDDY